MTPTHGPDPRRPGRYPTPAFGWDPTTLLLAGLVTVLGLGVLAWIGPATSGYLTTGRFPDGGPAAALRALTVPGDPGSAWPVPAQLPGPLGYWSATLIALAAFAITATIVVRVWRAHRRDDDATARALARTPGLATPGQVTRLAGRTAVLARAAVVRPSRAGTDDPHQVGYRIGALAGRDLWCTVEDSVLLVGPPRMGKGLHVVIPWVLDAPGPVITTSTRPDTLAITRAHRADLGPVAVFDPQHLTGAPDPDGLAWSPVRGCEQPRTALVRARGLAAGVGYGRSVSDGDFWTGQTETALRCLLHAAALDHRDAHDLYRWSLNPVLAHDAITILNRTRAAAEGWADALDAIVGLDPRTRDSVWLGVRQALAALADPAVLAAVTPRHGRALQPEAFLAARGTLYLLASAVAAGSCAPLVAALVEDLTETARTLAAGSHGARLDPPLLLALDEIANLTPLPSLPSLMAEGGGSGITTLTVLQSLAQARNRWGEHSTDAIWDAATVKIILGGLGKYRDLDDISALLGQVDQPTHSHSHARRGEASTTTSLRTIPVMPPAVLRTLPVGAAVLLLRHARPAITTLTPWTTRPDAPQLQPGSHGDAQPTPAPRTLRGWAGRIRARAARMRQARRTRRSRP